MYVTVTAQNFLPYQGISECTGNLPPVAEFTFDPLVPTRHDTVLFSSTSYDDDGTIVIWQWDFGDDSTASGEGVTHLFENYIPYTVTLIVEDDGGAVDTAQMEVAVEPICGDVDDDGAGPNVGDLTYLVEFLFDEGSPPPVMEAANVDGEGGVNVADLSPLPRQGWPCCCYLKRNRGMSVTLSRGMMEYGTSRSVHADGQGGTKKSLCWQQMGLIF
jgi:hypothetical protein